MTERLTIYDIIGANVRDFRLRKGLKQEECVKHLRRYGLKWDRYLLGITENGKRPIKADEILALARFFDVPFWAFVWPTPEQLPQDVMIGEDEFMPASAIVTQMVGAPDDDVDYNPLLKATMLVSDAIRIHGAGASAVKEIREALR